MSIYNKNGIQLETCYSESGNECELAYSLDGTVIHRKNDPYLPNRVLLFEDNFDGNHLDNNNWTPEIGYVRGANFYSGQNVEVSDGYLTLYSKREGRSTSGWTVGSVIGCGFQSWMYGRFEAKMKTDGLSGSFGAFWGVSNSYRTTREKSTAEDGTIEFLQQTEGDTGSVTWPASGEFDVIEMIPGDTQRPPCNLWGTDNNSLGSQRFIIDIDLKQWHIYSMEWTPQYIAMFVDGIEYKRWTFSDYEYDLIKPYLTEPMSLILTEGANGSGGQTDPSINEHWAKFDWVRVYAPLGYTQEIPVESINMPSTFQLKKGYQKYMVPQISPLTATNRHVSWASSNENILTVDHGMMRGIDYGTALLIAMTDNGKVAVCSVNVVDELT